MISLGLDIGGSSVKAALTDAGKTLATAQSQPYRRPTLDELASALRSAASTTGALARPFQTTGLCAPGLVDADGVTVRTSVNIPDLQGVRLTEFISRALSVSASPPRVFTDAHAAAHDLWSRDKPRGRFLAISIGTGVGACVLDDGRPLHVSATSPGHLGQIDVSLDEHAPIGPDGGRGSLEAYIGLPALERRYGSSLEQALGAMSPADPPLRALARAIRITHAIYRPQTIALLGGVGIRLRPILPVLESLIDDALSSLARPDRALVTGDSQFHAAVGAANLAAHA